MTYLYNDYVLRHIHHITAVCGSSGLLTKVSHHFICVIIDTTLGLSVVLSFISSHHYIHCACIIAFNTVFLYSIQFVLYFTVKVKVWTLAIAPLI